MNRFLLLAALMGGVTGCQQPPTPPQPTTLSVLYGAPARLNSVYWINTTACQNRLGKIIGVTVVEGDASNLELTLERDVQIDTWQCPGFKAPGGLIYVTMKQPVTKPTPITLRYVVTYDDVTGARVTSNHTRNLILEPASAPK